MDVCLVPLAMQIDCEFVLHLLPHDFQNRMLPNSPPVCITVSRPISLHLCSVHLTLKNLTFSIALIFLEDLLSQCYAVTTNKTCCDPDLDVFFLIDNTVKCYICGGAPSSAQ